MLALALVGLWRVASRHAGEARGTCVRGWLMIPSGFVAVLTGWWVAEVGRQPWVVYGLCAPSEAASRAAGGSVMASLVTFVLVYLGIFGAGLWYLIKLFRTGPVALRRYATSARTRRRRARCRCRRQRWRSETMDLATVLPVVWFFIIGFGVMMYVLLDGFVLGLGILAPFADDEHQRDHMMNTAAPIWDGNETWLVLGGAGLLAAFPKAYALVLSTLYLPVLLMLIALVFRGVAFEFRFKATPRVGCGAWRSTVGSVLAAFAQGVILGALVEGIAAARRQVPCMARSPGSARSR